MRERLGMKNMPEVLLSWLFGQVMRGLPNPSAQEALESRSATLFNEECVLVGHSEVGVTAFVVVLLTSIHHVRAAGSPTMDQMVGVTRSLLRVGVRCEPLKGI